MQTTRLRYLVTRLSGNRAVSGAAAAVGALGVVYGDVGTSPLYALRLAVLAGNGSTSLPAPEIVIGVVSTILWLLIIIVSLKCALLILRADNKGEGGILSLFALLRAKKRSKHMERAIIVFACLGAGLLYGEV